MDAPKQFSPHFEVLPAAQKALWESLRPAKDLGFVLYGGTAISLQLGHRMSVDFDFFTQDALDQNALVAALPFLEETVVIQDEPESFTVLASGKEEPAVKLQFFGGIAFGRVEDPRLTEDGVLQVASLDDLMATKVKTILQRVEYKDYADIAAMAEAGVPLDKALAAAHQMYAPRFQPSESLKAITFFQGGDLELLNENQKRILVEAVRGVRRLPEVDLLLGLAPFRREKEALSLADNTNGQAGAQALFHRHAEQLAKRYGSGVDAAQAERLIADKLAAEAIPKPIIAAILEAQTKAVDRNNKDALKRYADRLATTAVDRLRDREGEGSRSNEIERKA